MHHTKDTKDLHTHTPTHRNHSAISKEIKYIYILLFAKSRRAISCKVDVRDDMSFAVTPYDGYINQKSYTDERNVQRDQETVSHQCRRYI